jgi:hypothetical protein
MVEEKSAANSTTEAECRRRQSLAGRLIVTGEEIHHHGTNEMWVRLLHRMAELGFEESSRDT